MTWHWANDQTANNDNRRTFDSSLSIGIQS